MSLGSSSLEAAIPLSAGLIIVALIAPVTVLAVQRSSRVVGRAIPRCRCYAWAIGGQAVMTAAVSWPIHQYGLDDTLRMLAQWWEIPMFGWVVVIAYWAGIASPPLTLVIVSSIWRARRQLATASVRRTRA